MDGLDDSAFIETLASETGERPRWTPGGFADPFEDVKESMARIEADPFLVSKKVRGFVFDVADGRLNEVSR
jgi:carbonic anhydrase